MLGRIFTAVCCLVLMLAAAWENKTVTGARIERHFTARELNVAPDDVHQLFMRVAVPRSDPPSFHKVSYQHELLVVCQYLPREAGFRRK